VVEAFSRADGKRLWERRVEAEGPLTPAHEKHNLASSSPVTDGEMVFAWFGTGQLIALTRDGSIGWQRHLGKEVSTFDIQWGHSSSPVLYRDLVILLCDQPSASYLLALDKRTGKERWKVDRGTGRSSYSTPLVVEHASGAELIVNSSERIDAYDPATGRALWYTGEANRFPIPTPVVHDGIVYASRGYRSGPYMAIRTGGSGDVSATHVVWRVPTGAPYVSSLLHYDGVVYMANDVGVLTAVDAKTGERLWQQRVDGVFSASPVGGAGHVYFVSENGDTVVVKAGRSPEIVGRNAIGERALASPALSNGRMFIRTDDHVFCIGS
jgi:outer membrane protein assembly factor BamB